MLKNLIFIATIVAVASALNSQDYCDPTLCQYSGGAHTVCSYPNDGPASTCGQGNKIGLTDEEKKLLVDLHNQLRQKVASGNETRGSPGPQPGATNMETMEWDDEIAEIAQRWADQCAYGHDGCRNVERFQVGQNIVLTPLNGVEYSSEFVKSSVMRWYDEVALFSSSMVSSFSLSEQTGHYTQIVWAETNKLGCGAAVYSWSGYDSFYLVCDYGPTGNWAGQPMYKTK